MPFDAAEVVAEDDLAFDFSAFDGPKGTIPEPTREQVDAYFKGVREAIRKAGLLNLGDDPASPQGRAALSKALEDADEDELEASREERMRAIVDLCSGTPSIEQIEALPYRVQQAFFGWLTGKFVNPTSQNGASAG